MTLSSTAVKSKANARYSKLYAEQGSACSLITNKKEVVGCDAESESMRSVDSVWVLIYSTKGLR